MLVTVREEACLCVGPNMAYASSQGFGASTSDQRESGPSTTITREVGVELQVGASTSQQQPGTNTEA